MPPKRPPRRPKILKNQECPACHKKFTRKSLSVHLQRCATYARISNEHDMDELLDLAPDPHKDTFSLFSADDISDLFSTSSAEMEKDDTGSPQSNLDNVDDERLNQFFEDAHHIEESNASVDLEAQFASLDVSDDEEWWMEFEVEDIDDQEVIEDEDSNAFEELVEWIDREMHLEMQQNGESQTNLIIRLC
jgi:hypothetical protein